MKVVNIMKKLHHNNFNNAPSISSAVVSSVSSFPNMNANSATTHLEIPALAASNTGDLKEAHELKLCDHDTPSESSMIGFVNIGYTEEKEIKSPRSNFQSEGPTPTYSNMMFFDDDDVADVPLDQDITLSNLSKMKIEHTQLAAARMTPPTLPQKYEQPQQQQHAQQRGHGKHVRIQVVTQDQPLKLQEVPCTSIQFNHSERDIGTAAFVELNSHLVDGAVEDEEEQQHLSPYSMVFLQDECERNEHELNTVFGGDKLACALWRKCCQNDHKTTDLLFRVLFPELIAIWKRNTSCKRIPRMQDMKSALIRMGGTQTGGQLMVPKKHFYQFWQWFKYGCIIMDELKFLWDSFQSNLFYTRQDTELLLSELPPGTFIVRLATAAANSLVISYVDNTLSLSSVFESYNVKHIILKRHSTFKYLVLSKKGKQASALQQIIRSYVKLKNIYCGHKKVYPKHVVF
eukprot:CAMPEP_0202691420 /NCGR_PEP_ID=MMETSP1385-20130828/6142_1 /ASSEMBLY_ACC=CAM_ASM_000861 /TAXON_ID=933848 /ORGANISM="Elphidium margaritaceum" /LENGTH=458 /DNA_ID=CAMNT_0049346823 /DNA_START=36 /DNA_END=1412 /DNA_ORIENTATION=-